MKIDGVDGHVTAKGHEKWIELSSFNFGVMRQIATKPGNVSDRENSKPSLTEVSIKKEIDKTSPKLFEYACGISSNPSIPKLLIHICQTGSNQISPYIEYTLQNVLISRYEVDIDPTINSNLPLEFIHLNYDKFEMKYTNYDEKHKAGSPITAGYDLSKAEKI